MNSINERDTNISSSAESIVDASVSLGLNIYRFSRRIKDFTQPFAHKAVRLPYGSYFGGDVSTGGGEPISLDRWMAEP